MYELSELSVSEHIALPDTVSTFHNSILQRQLLCSCGRKFSIYWKFLLLQALPLLSFCVSGMPRAKHQNVLSEVKEEEKSNIIQYVDFLIVILLQSHLFVTISFSTPFPADHGKVLKTINAASADDSSKVSSVVIEELDVLAKPEPIRNLKIVRTMQYGEFDVSLYLWGKLLSTSVKALPSWRRQSS